jgi:hypothetical protein
MDARHVLSHRDTNVMESVQQNNGSDCVQALFNMVGAGAENQVPECI